MYKRILDLKLAKKSFFVWGQRQTGKSTLLKNNFPEAFHINLLKSDEFLDYSTKPSLIRERISHLPEGSVVIIDEIQKIPLLLDEVHYLIEEKKIIFGLCGSSARKLKREHANLLGGRAKRFELYGLSAYELQSDFNLTQMLNRGYLPSLYLDEDYKDSQKAYVSDYLQEEILAESLTRNLPQFSRFLEVAALDDTHTINFSNIAREVGVSSITVRDHYQILVDTLIGGFLEAYTKNNKRRVKQSSKFYFFDIGIVNYLTHRSNLVPKSSDFGKAFENWVYHELLCYKSYKNSNLQIRYWALASGAEVDFILDDMQIAIEAKATEQVNDNHLKGLREIKKEYSHIQRRIIISLDRQYRQTQDGIEIIPYESFIHQLWDGKII